MNLCVLSGIVRNEPEFNFIYDEKKKSLGKDNISVVKATMELNSNQTVEVHAYNEMADFFYQRIRKGDYILVEGKIKNNFVEVSLFWKL